MVVKVSSAQVNAWRLSHHHLLERSRKRDVEKVVSDVCGVQAQVLSYAALAIWARVEGITHQDIQDALWRHRTLVKTWCMRGTLHLLSSTDLPTYVAARKTTQVIKEDWLTPEINVDTRKKITSTIREALDAKSLTREELAGEVLRRLSLTPNMRKHMVSGWGNLLQPAAEQGYLCFGPSQGAKVTFVRPDKWIGIWDEPDGSEAWNILLRRFFKAYGPASHHDLGHWWGLRPDKARTIMENIAGELAEVDFEGEKKLVLREDLASITEAQSARSVRLLPSWDVYVMFYHPRERFISKTHRERVFTKLQGNRPVLLVNGVAGGVWEQKRKGGVTEIQVRPFGHLSSDQKRQVKDEAAGIGEFLGTAVKVSIL